MARTRPIRWLPRCPLLPFGWRDRNSVSLSHDDDVPTRQMREWFAGGLSAFHALRNGELAVEHGLHQEIGWERQTDTSGISMTFFADNVRNPIIDAASRIAARATRSQLRASLLYDQASGMLHTAGPDLHRWNDGCG